MLTSLSSVQSATWPLKTATTSSHAHLDRTFAADRVLQTDNQTELAAQVLNLVQKWAQFCTTAQPSLFIKKKQKKTHCYVATDSGTQLDNSEQPMTDSRPVSELTNFLTLKKPGAARLSHKLRLSNDICSHRLLTDQWLPSFGNADEGLNYWNWTNA